MTGRARFYLAFTRGADFRGNRVPHVDEKRIINTRSAPAGFVRPAIDETRRQGEPYRRLVTGTAHVSARHEAPMPTTRRNMLVLLAGALAAPAAAQTPGMSRLTAYAFKFTALDGGDIRLADFAGKPILVVNTASQCGFTPQYAGLQQLWTRYHDRGLMMIAMPSNDFGGQEPGGAPEIQETANRTYGVTFPIAEKAAVKGANPHPFYKWAASERPLDVPRWNFHKYLVGRDGHIVAAFLSEVEPTDSRVIMAIEKELA
jgi:glutathione peroxidase